MSRAGALLLLVVAGCGTITPCGPSNCASGCCDESGTCRPGNTQAVCGAGANACVACESQATCVLGRCEAEAAPIADAGTDAGQPTVDAGPVTTDAGQGLVRINELATSDGDFVELVNTGTADFDLSGYRLADRDASDGGPKLSEALTFPQGTTLPAGARLLAPEGSPPGSACDAGSAPCLLVGFGLSNGGGDTVFLIDASGVPVDEVVFPPGGHAAGQSWSRIPDGTGPFQAAPRSPGAPNSP